MSVPHCALFPLCIGLTCFVQRVENKYLNDCLLGLVIILTTVCNVSL